MPNEVPSANTPSVADGDIRSFAKVGSTMVMGGNFTNVAGQTRNRIAAFNPSTGALTSFAPDVDGEVTALAPGPSANTVYAGGSFSSINGTQIRGKLALLNLSTGQVDPSFTAAALNTGNVRDFVKVGNRLITVGSFTRVGGTTHGGIAALDATTGAALHSYMAIALSGRHNDSGSGAQGPVGPWNIDVTPGGDRAAIVGNFKYADGELHDQVAQIDLSGSAASVANWQTNRYSPYCFNWAFDSYVRGVSYSPDGSYFVVTSTGGGVQNTLCDAAARFETNATGSNLEPTWVSETGGDTMWAVEITESAVFIGGHQRWGNNPYGSDWAAPGAVPRAGLVSLDPVSGRPLAWNPGRNPPGKAVYALLATSEGLWMGSNTDWVGNRKYQRRKLVLFPYAGGQTLEPTNTGKIPGTVLWGGVPNAATSNVLYRVNAGGPAIGAVDAGPDWEDDSSSGGYHNGVSNAAGWSPSATNDGSVPSGTPMSIFDSERWDPSDASEMEWTFPITAGTPVQVRLFLANRCDCTASPGSRVFDIDVNGSNVVNDIDLSGTVGHNVATMRSVNLTVPGSGQVKIRFGHVVENPLINGIEIIRTDIPPPTAVGSDTLNATKVTTTGVTSPSIQEGTGVDWTKVRAATMVGSTVFTAETDGYFHRRAYDGTTFGPDVKVDPYHDPLWKDVDNNLGGTFDGNLPTLYGQIGTLTGMFYDGGKLYYARSGQSALQSRWFSPDSGIVDERTFSISGLDFSTTRGIFVASGKLYFVKADGSLWRMNWQDGAPSGTPEQVSSPATGGPNFKNRAFFLYAGAPINQAPVAAFTSTCNQSTCTFDGTGSTDPDGSIASYAWDFGDGDQGTGATPQHVFGDTDTYSVKLTVTDNEGATATITQNVAVVAPPNQDPTAAFTANCTGATCAFDAGGSSDPDGSIDTYAWDFGDGTTGTGATPSRTYSGASGARTVTLTVTDNRGATDSASRTVNVTIPQGTVEYVGTSNSNTGGKAVKQVAIPTGAAVGDVAVMYFTRPTAANFGGPTGVTGWTQIGDTTSGNIVSTVWSKRLTAGDLSGTVTFTDTAVRLGTIQVVVYRGVGTSSIEVASAVAGATTSHGTPAIPVRTGDLVTRFVAVKMPQSAVWSVPSGMNDRGRLADTASTPFDSIALDPGVTAAANGTAPAVTVETSNPSSRAVWWSIALPSQ